MEHIERWSPFLYRDFTLACIARFGFGFGTQMQAIAIAWHVYDTTGDALALGFIGLAGFIPAVALVLVGGIVVDTVERRLVLAASIAMMAATAVGLVAYVYSGITAIWPVYLLVVCYASARAFYNPASQAIIPNLVPKHHFANAVAFGSSVMQIAMISGPAVGGLLYAVHPTAPFLVSALSFAIGAASMAFVRPRPTPPAPGARDWKSLLAGLKFTRDQPVVLGAISLDMFAVILGGAIVLLPIFAKDILGVGSWGVGLLRSAPAIGALIAAAIISSRPPISRGAGRLLLTAVACYGLMTIGFGLSQSFLLSMLLLVAIGAADMVSVCLRMTMVQAETPDDLRGRVASVNSVFIATSNEIGLVGGGVMAWLFGPVAAALIAGTGAIMVAATWSRLFPALREREALVLEDKSNASERQKETP